MKQRFWAMLIALLMFCTGAMADGSVCETCGGRGYLEMQSFDSEGTVRVVCPACFCKTCGGRGYLEMRAYDVEGTVRVVCPDCSGKGSGEPDGTGLTVGVELTGGVTEGSAPELNPNRTYTFADAQIESAVCEQLG